MRPVCHSESDIHIIMHGYYIFYINISTNDVMYNTCGLRDSAGSTKKLAIVCSFFFVLVFFKQI